MLFLSFSVSRCDALLLLLPLLLLFPELVLEHSDPTEVTTQGKKEKKQKKKKKVTEAPFFKYSTCRGLSRKNL